MKNKLPETLIKLCLGGFELLFVGILGYYRVMNIGWMLIIFGLGILVWVLVHIGLMTAFIASFKLRVVDILLYLAVHFFYLFAFLFQADGGDTGEVTWTIQHIYPWPPLDPFLNKWGDTVFWYAFAGTMLCYLLLSILLVFRLVKYARAQKKLVP